MMRRSDLPPGTPNIKSMKTLQKITGTLSLVIALGLLTISPESLSIKTVIVQVGMIILFGAISYKLLYHETRTR